MEDNKQPNSKDTTPSNDSANVSGGKSREELKKEVKISLTDFGAAGVDDINKNLGSFTNTVKQQESTPKEIKLDVDSKVVDQASKETINFERFSKTRKDLGEPKTKFGEKVGLMLRSKKGLTITWVLELSIMAIIIAVSVTLIVFFSKFKNWQGDGPFNYGWVQTCLKTGLVFHWISMFPCVAPIIYLITSWFIGINAVHSSKMYHYFFWITGAISVLTFLVGFGLMMPCIVEYIRFGGYHIANLLMLI